MWDIKIKQNRKLSVTKLLLLKNLREILFCLLFFFNEVPFGFANSKEEENLLLKKILSYLNWSFSPPPKNG